MKMLCCKAVQSFAAAFYFTSLAIILIAPHVCKAQQITATPVEHNFHNASDKSVVLNVTVTNERGDYIVGLGKASFALYDNKVPQEFTFLGRKDAPVSVNILLDVSGSISDETNKNKAAFIRDALRVFLKVSNSNNEYFLTAFNDKAHVIGSSHTAETVLEAVWKFQSDRCLLVFTTELSADF